MQKSLEIVSDKIESLIFNIRGLQVMLDRDLAELYQVPVKALNQAVKRNIHRFPERFRFQLSINETSELVTNCDRFKTLKHSSVLPSVFTESGVAMLSAILNSDIAVKASIRIMDAFVTMRKVLLKNGGLIQRIEGLEIKQIEADKKFDKIFNALESKDVIPQCGVFFDGQIFDAYILVNKIIKSAKKSIILIDNYIDESVLTMFSRKAKNVKITILTRDISKKISLDIEKFNKQYSTIEAKIFNLSHDRFLIIDEKDIYHLGASLKDLGKKWFAFSKMSEDFGLLEKITA